MKRAVAVVYVVVVAVLAFSAFHDRSATFGSAEAALFVLTLPTLIVALPGVYVGGAAIHNVADFDHGGPMWPVTLVYVLMFAGIAVLNVWLFHLVADARRRKITA